MQKLCVGSACITELQLAAILAATGQSPAASGGSPSALAASSSAPTTPSTPPVLTIAGENPAHIHVGDTYNDLGAIITAPEQDKNLGIKTYLNGALVSDIVLDTSQAAADTIDYVVTDQNGLTSTSTRTVIVEAAAAAEPPPSTEETLPPTEPTPPAPDTAATPATDLSTEAVGTGVLPAARFRVKLAEKTAP